jgi:hypothetical protein
MHRAQCFCVEKRPPTEHANRRGILPSCPTEMQNCHVSLHRGKSFILLSLSPSSIRKQRSSVVHRRGGRGDLQAGGEPQLPCLSTKAASARSAARGQEPRLPRLPAEVVPAAPVRSAARAGGTLTHAGGQEPWLLRLPAEAVPAAPTRSATPAPAARSPRSRVPTLASSIQARSSPVLNRAPPRPPNRDRRR